MNRALAFLALCSIAACGNVTMDPGAAAGGVGGAAGAAGGSTTASGGRGSAGASGGEAAAGASGGANAAGGRGDGGRGELAGAGGHDLLSAAPCAGVYKPSTKSVCSGFTDASGAVWYCEIGCSSLPAENAAGCKFANRGTYCVLDCSVCHL